MENYSTALIDSVMQQQATMIVNGQPQGGQMVRVYYVKCKNCDRMLAQFNPGEHFINIVNYCKQKLAPDFIYCPTCGCKLNYTMDIIDIKETQNESQGTTAGTATSDAQ